MIFLQWGSQVLVDHLREDLQLETLAILEKDCEIQTKMDEAAVVVERRIWIPCLDQSSYVLYSGLELHAQYSGHAKPLRHQMSPESFVENFLAVHHGDKRHPKDESRYNPLTQKTLAAVHKRH